jgi:hypothetical protein
LNIGIDRAGGSDPMRSPFRVSAAVTVSMACTIIFACDVTWATTPEAWAAHEREVVAACVAASRLRGAKPAGKLIEFDDRVGYSAVVIQGRYPQPHMKNQRGRVLCLFEKKTREVFVSPADSIVSTPRP